MDSTIATILIILLVALLVAAVLVIVGGWKMFKKAGRPGWEYIVPIYSSYVTGLIAGKRKLGIALAVLGLISVFTGTMLSNYEVQQARVAERIASSIGMEFDTTGMMPWDITDGYQALADGAYVKTTERTPDMERLDDLLEKSMVVDAVDTVFGLVAVVLYIIVSLALSKSFGRGTWFGLGIVFLPFIFIPMIGFKDSIQYVGPVSDEDDMTPKPPVAKVVEEKTPAKKKPTAKKAPAKKTTTKKPAAKKTTTKKTTTKKAPAKKPAAKKTTTRKKKTEDK